MHRDPLTGTRWAVIAYVLSGRRHGDRQGILGDGLAAEELLRRAMETTRRGFLLGIAAATTVTAAEATQRERTHMMPTTEDIREYLLSHSPWVDRDRTVDTVKAGDATQPVRKAGVCWYPSVWDIRAAVDAGCDLLIAHEPAFWEHGPEELTWRNRGPGIEKTRLLDESGLVILRAHDTWDNWPEIGIRDAWARFLHLGRPIAEGSNLRWHALYEIPEQTLGSFASYVAGRVRELGEEGIQVMGQAERTVRRVAIGVGCAVPDQEMIDAGADVLIGCYDGASYWAQRERCYEAGAAIITVEHGSSEMPGLMRLRDHLAEVFPSVEFIFVAEHPRTWTAH